MGDNKNSGPAGGVRGVVEDVRDKAEETAGTVAGRDDLVEEGKAQQYKAEAERDADLTSRRSGRVTQPGSAGPLLF